MKHVAALKNEFGLFVIILLAAILVVGGIYLYRESLIEDSRHAQNRMNSIQKKYQNAKNRMELMEQHKASFALLKDRDIIGEENRLNWIDTLDTIIKRDQIPYLKYDINSQKKFADRSILKKFPKIDIYTSEMTLDMRLLHEADLYTIINTLEADAKGLFEVERCNVQRTKVSQLSLVDSGTDNNFKARCDLNWYTFQPQDSKL